MLKFTRKNVKNVKKNVKTFKLTYIREFHVPVATLTLISFLMLYTSTHPGTLTTNEPEKNHIMTSHSQQSKPLIICN